MLESAAILSLQEFKFGVSSESFPKRKLLPNHPVPHFDEIPALVIVIA
jgi:hypothetical protein